MDDRNETFERELESWRANLGSDQHFLANIDMLAERAKHGGAPASSGSITERLARLVERHKKA